MSVIGELIWDRTQADVDRVRELKQKALTGGGISALTESERNEYFNSPKGAYNYTDLNRVDRAVEYLYELFTLAGKFSPEYSPPKINWSVSDIPTQEQMNLYLNNVSILRTLAGISGDLPSSMNRLTYNGANQIEKTLANVNHVITQTMRNWMYSGEFESAEL